MRQTVAASLHPTDTPAPLTSCSVQVIDVELVGSPDPADVMTTSARTVLTKLDKVRP